MRYLASLLITASLVLGLYSALTAYVVPLDAIDPATETVRLNAPAGQSPDDPSQPLVTPADLDDGVLTDDAVNRLEAAGVDRIRVKEFAIGRWTGKWWFLLSCAGLIGGGVMLRREKKRAVMLTLQRTADHEESAEHALTEVRERLASLKQALEAETDPAERRSLIVHRIDALQRGPLMAFVGARAELTGKLGVAGYAQLMDRFAASERQINRAWSAAADENLEEAMDSLDVAVERLEETAERMK